MKKHDMTRQQMLGGTHEDMARNDVALVMKRTRAQRLEGVRRLEPDDDTWQSLYHFTVGGAVEDDRLQTMPAYEHLGPRANGRGGSRDRG